jgi:uncharacterized Zn finger protein
MMHKNGTRASLRNCAKSQTDTGCLAARGHSMIGRCEHCGEVMPGPHNCDQAREARALFEAAKRANNDESANRLSKAALAMSIKSEENE